MRVFVISSRYLNSVKFFRLFFWFFSRLYLQDFSDSFQILHAGRALRILRLAKLLSLVRLLRLSRLVRYVSQWEEVYVSTIDINCAAVLLLYIYHCDSCFFRFFVFFACQQTSCWFNKQTLLFCFYSQSLSLFICVSVFFPFFFVFRLFRSIKRFLLYLSSIESMLSFDSICIPFLHFQSILNRNSLFVFVYSFLFSSNESPNCTVTYCKGRKKNNTQKESLTNTRFF